MYKQRLGLKFAVSLACLLLMGASPADSGIALDSSNGSIKVGVADVNGKPAVGIQVRLFHAKAHQKKAQPTASFIRIRRVIERSAGGHAAVASGTTGNGGYYFFANVPPGDYTVVAGIPGGTTVGHASASVTAGQETDVPVTLEPKKNKSGT